MYLNKHGWGLREMLVLSGILIIFLIIAIYYIYLLYNNVGEEYTIDYYTNLEDKLEHQSLIYLNDYYEANLTSDYIIISRSILRNYDLDIPLNDPYGDACSGYVTVNKSKGIINTKGYIKCNNYVTDGYEEWKN